MTEREAERGGDLERLRASFGDDAGALPAGTLDILAKAWTWMRAWTWLTRSSLNALQEGVGEIFTAAGVDAGTEGSPVRTADVAGREYRSWSGPDADGREDGPAALRRDAAERLTLSLRVRPAWREVWAPRGDGIDPGVPEAAEFRIALAQPGAPVGGPPAAPTELRADGRIAPDGTALLEAGTGRLMMRTTDDEGEPGPWVEVPADAPALGVLDWLAESVVEAWAWSQRGSGRGRYGSRPGT